MSDFVRTIAICAVVGAAVAGSLALPEFLPSAIANEEPAKTLLSAQKELFPKPVDLNGLVKYDLTFDDKVVSTEVQSTELVRKIGYGHSSLVRIAHTSSGTYSSDGLKSPHILYPGIEVNVTPDYEHIHDLLALGAWAGRFSYHGSFVIIVDGTRL